jgi:NTE family protein
MNEQRSSIGLALGSGVARGWAHIGVLRGLERLGVKPDIICGTSVGAFVGGIYLDGRLDELEDFGRRLTRLKLSRFVDLQFGRGGLMAGRRVAEIFEPAFRDRLIEDLPARLACVATELGSGHEVWLQQGNFLEAARASYGLPGVLPPVRIDGRWLIDGALVNPVPVSVCRALGARYVIAVNLNTDAFGQEALETVDEIGLGDDDAPAGFLKGIPGAASIRQLFSSRNSEPSLFTVMASSLNIVQDRLTRSRLAGDPPDLMIAPKLGDIGLMQFGRAAEAIAAGEQEVEQAAPALTELLRRANDKR